MSRPTASRKRPPRAGITITSPPPLTPWRAPYAASGGYSRLRGNGKVLCEVDHPNGTIYSQGKFDVTGSKWATQFNSLPPTAQGQAATLNAYLYTADGTIQVGETSELVLIV